MSNPSFIPFIDEKGNHRKMTLRLNDKIAIPIFEQLRAQISVMIAVGYLLPHCRLPTVRELAACLEIAPGTIARSYTELERDGLTIGRGRKGTFVADKPPHSEPLVQRQFRLSEAAIRFVQELRQLGISLEEAQFALEEKFKSEEKKDSFSSLNENMSERN
tara:strand:- start:228 stop:710 length:483 start_codon:yes stop_codon:yes gene_type:complete